MADDTKSPAPLPAPSDNKPTPAPRPIPTDDMPHAPKPVHRPNPWSDERIAEFIRRMKAALDANPELPPAVRQAFVNGVMAMIAAQKAARDHALGH